MTMKNNPAPFRDFQRLPDTLTVTGDIGRTSLTTHLTAAAIREYRSIAGQPAADPLIIEGQTRTIRETTPERVNTHGIKATRPALLKIS